MLIYILIKGISLILVLLNVSFLVILTPKRTINALILLQTNIVSMDVQFCEGESYFSGNASLVPLQGEISSKE